MLHRSVCESGVSACVKPGFGPAGPMSALRGPLGARQRAGGEQAGAGGSEQTPQAPQREAGRSAAAQADLIRKQREVEEQKREMALTVVEAFTTMHEDLSAEKKVMKQWAKREMQIGRGGDLAQAYTGICSGLWAGGWRR
jgi:hypothetical protein